MHHIYSTLAADTQYASYEKGPNNLRIVSKRVLIKGGTGVAHKNLITPLGVLTTVSDEDMASLEANPVFKTHIKNGFIRVTAHKTDPEKVASDMKARDISAPLVPQDFEGEAGARPMGPIANSKINPLRSLLGVKR